jgi:hypothetical protein
MSDEGRVRRWARWAGEVVVIVASVFVAIYLEGLADDAERADDAHAVLAQVATELASDRRAIPEIIQQQSELADYYESLRRWMADPRSLPTDSVQEALDYVGFNNRTLYPSSGAWRALTSAGQLVWVEDRALVARLADFYENRTIQLEYNGRDYDFNVNEVIRVTSSRAWDYQRQEARTDGGADLVELSGQLRYLGTSWNPHYIDLLGEYAAEIDALLEDIDAYLTRAGDG